MKPSPKRIILKQLGELLVEKNIIDQNKLDHALEIQRQKDGLLGEILVKLGYVTEEQIAQTITAQYGYPYLPLRHYEVEPEVIKIVPERIARHYCLIPVNKIEELLTIAMSNPLNIEAIGDIEHITGLSTQIFVSTATDIREAINRYYSGGHKG